MNFSLIKRICFLMLPLMLACNSVDELDISGTWKYRLDPKNIGLSESWHLDIMEEEIDLPAALRDYKIGDAPSLHTDWTGSIYDSSWYFNPDLEKYRIDDIKFPFWLTPVSHYKGAAWFQREIKIPDTWDDKNLNIKLERPHWQTQVWIDTICLGSDNSLSVPHRFALDANRISPGLHTLTIRVDNAIRELDPGINSHSISDHTQGNWNGIVGEMTVQAVSSNGIEKIKITPDVKNRSSVAAITLKNNSHLAIDAFNIEIKGVNHTHQIKIQNYKPETNDKFVEVHIPMGDEMKTWSEFSPDYYQMEVKALKGNKIVDSQKEYFGMRNFTLDNLHFAINGKPVFLRGTTECAVFPLTGYPPTDVAAWDSVFAVCKSFGLNHMRFHSYCPPEAAFVAADKAGIYLQVEGPSWAKYSTSLGYERPIDQYLMDETKRIIDEYGNHPSFVMMAYGNEPSGRYVGYLENWVDHFRQYDSRILYTGASTGGSWYTIENSDFIVRAPPRGLDWKNKAPESEFDYRHKTENQDKPYVTFEMGQWCAYPNFEEIDKYTGVLKAKNFELFEEDLSDKGMANQAHDFLMASGKLQASCYKQEIEATLRTPNLAGFQLLALNDFPGQGTALVGVLDAFWQEKGYVSAKEFSTFCNPLVPLVRLPKFVFSTNDTLISPVEIANFSGQDIAGADVHWRLESEGRTLSSSSFENKHLAQGGNNAAGKIILPLSEIVNNPSKLELVVEVQGHKNSWNIWVYPPENVQKTQDILVCEDLTDEAKKVLKDGGKVLLLAVENVEAGDDVVHYQTPVFWNTSWFRMRPPHTTGLLIENQHPLFSNFPTDYYTDHQWWDIANRAKIMNLSYFPEGFKPLIQPIDTWFLNRRLGMLFEAKVGKGSLFVTSLDLSTNIEERPVALRLYNSIVDYCNSNDFTPQQKLSFEHIEQLFSPQKKACRMYNKTMP